MDFVKTAEELNPIRVLLQSYRNENGISIPQEDNTKVQLCFKECTKLSLQLHNTKLSTTETLVMALALANRCYEIRSITLGMSINTIKEHEYRVKTKLHVNSKLLAFCLIIQEKIIEVF